MPAIIKPYAFVKQNFFEKIFGSGGGTGTPTPPATAANTPAPAPAATPAPAPAPAAQEDDFAKFKDLWNVDPNANSDKNAPIFGEVDPAKLQEAAGKINFAQVIPADTMQKITAGGQEGAEAFALAMNKITQASYAQSALATTKIVEQALAKQQEKFEKMIPDIVKRNTVSNTLRADNPLFSRPEVAPIIGALEFQLTAQYPNATPTEISTMAVDYLKGLAKVVSPPSKDSASDGKSGKDDFDWDAFANS